MDEQTSYNLMLYQTSIDYNNQLLSNSNSKKSIIMSPTFLNEASSNQVSGDHHSQRTLLKHKQTRAFNDSNNCSANSNQEIHQNNHSSGQLPFRKRFSRSYTFQSSSSSSANSGESMQFTCELNNKQSELQIDDKNMLFQIVEPDTNFIFINQKKRNSTGASYGTKQSRMALIDITTYQENQIDLQKMFPNTIIQESFQEIRFDSNQNKSLQNNYLKMHKEIVESRSDNNQLSHRQIDKAESTFQSHYKHYFHSGDNTPKQQLVKKRPSDKKTNQLNQLSLDNNSISAEGTIDIHQSSFTNKKQDHEFHYNDSLKSSHRSLSLSQQEIHSPTQNQIGPLYEVENSIRQEQPKQRVIEDQEVDLKILCNFMAGCFMNAFSIVRRRTKHKETINKKYGPYQKIDFSSSKFDVLSSQVKEDQINSLKKSNT
eukprot:403342102